MATHSSICAWRILCTEEPGGYSPWVRKGLDMTEQLRMRARVVMHAYKTVWHSGVLQGTWLVLPEGKVCCSWRVRTEVPPVLYQNQSEAGARELSVAT